MDDKILIINIKNNPTDGLKQTFSIYGSLVKAVIIKVSGRNESRDIEECVADTFVKLWQSINSFNEQQGTLKSYIIGIARHVAVDRIRKTANKTELELLDENEIEQDLDMENEVSRAINRGIVKDAIESMPATDRTIFIRRYYLFEKINEIATFLNLNSKYVEKRLYRGKRKLKKELVQRGIIL